MNALANPTAVAEEMEEADAPVSASSLPAQIKTCKKLPRTRLGETHGVFKVEAGKKAGFPPPSIKTRQRKELRRRRQKRVLIALAVVLAVFPPMWAVYFIGLLIWLTRPRQKSMRRVRKAVRAIERNQTGPALRHLQEAHYRDPSNSDALYWLGLLLSRLDRHEEAEEALSLVAERVPGLPEVESALVEAYIAMEEPENAIYHAQRLFDERPYASHSLLTLADAFEAAGRLDLAIKALEQAPIHKRVLTDALVKIHYRLGLLYEHQDDSEKALHHFKRVYARDISYKDVRSRVKALEEDLSQ